MITTNRIQNLDDNVTGLITAYQQAMKESDQSGFVTKAEVTRSVIDSARALANRLRTREKGTDELVQKLEHYYQALHAEDWVEKSRSAITKAAAIMGITAGLMLALVINAFLALVEGSIAVGNNLWRYIIAYPSAFVLLLRFLGMAYNDYSKAQVNPSMASSILSRTVDPAEQQVYALIGGSRPARTFERINQGGAIAVGVIIFVVACGILWGVLQAL